MRGNVVATVYDGSDTVISEVQGPNMACVGGAEVLVDGLTMSPSLSAIASASAILDTSNYTIHGISFGKSYDGYSRYAHSSDLSAFYPATVTGAVMVDTINAVSGLNVTSITGVLIPTYSNPDDRRLQMASTKASLSLAATADVGHNMNAMEFSATNGLGISSLGVGCFPPSAGIRLYYVTGPHSLTQNNFTASGIFESNFNKNHLMDPSGMLTMTVSSVEQGCSLAEFPNNQGLYMTSHRAGVSSVDVTGIYGAGFSGTDGKGQIGYNVILSGGDFALPNAYGGIFTMGLWCIDTKAMLAAGITPPFSFTALNNNRLYKLFAKKVFTKDLTFTQDNTSVDAGLINTFSTPYGDPFETGTGSTFKSKIQWRISF